jgi:hypothetical protein
MYCVRLLMFLAALTSAARSLSAAELTVVFRYDDCSMRSPIMSELEILRLFQKHGMRVTFALIPFVCAGNGHETKPQPELPYIQERVFSLSPFLGDSTLELALHGLRHQNVLEGGHPWKSDFIGVGYSEFYGLDPETQKSRIERGADYMENMFGVRPAVFVPPWNSYDTATVRALEDLGFACLSAGARGPAPLSSKLAFLPATCDNTVRMREAVVAWREGGCPEALLTVMLHASSFSGTEERRNTALAGLDSSLAWLGAQPGVRVLSLGQAAMQLPEIGPDRFHSYNSRRKAWYFLPRIIQTSPPELYLRGSSLDGLTRLGWTLTALLYALPLIFAVLVTAWLARRRRRMQKAPARN